MPSTTSSVVSIVLDSSTVMTPSLPTFFMASAMMLPTCLSVLALMVPTCAIMSPFTSRESLLISLTATSTALSMPRLSAIGLAPAATVRTPSRKIACAITGHIRRLGRNLAHHLSTHVFKRVLQLDLLCHRHTVFCDDGCTELLLDHRIAPLWPERDLQSVSQNVDDSQN